MKKLVIAAILALANVALAGPARVTEARPATIAEAKSFIEGRKDLKEYKEAAEGRKMTAALKQSLVKFLTESTSTIGSIDSSNLESLISTRPETLAKVVQLITSHKNGTAEQKVKATADLKILSEAGKYEMTATEVEGLEKITEMADYNEAAKEFKAELAQVLKLGKAITVTEAVKIASKGKITLEKIKECII